MVLLPKNAFISNPRQPLGGGGRWGEDRPAPLVHRCLRVVVAHGQIHVYIRVCA